MPDILQPRPPQRRISLTPLVDVIFLLLIFFMLTSQIAPFSLISLSGTKSETFTADTLSLPAKQLPKQTSAGALITVLNAGIAINGRRVPIENIDVELTALRDNGIKTAIISPRSSATVQDLITVLEAVKKAAFSSVTIRKSG